MNVKVLRRCASLVAITAATATGTSAGAQTADGVDKGDEIVVTASKRGDQSILEIPMSVTGISESALQRRGAIEINDIVKLVPALSISDQGPGNKRYVIRGIFSGGAGTVGVYLDEVVLTGENPMNGGGLQADPGLYDIERVEVLKGPQGTTFGSSALAGVVRYVVAKPSLTNIAFNGRAAVTHQKHAGAGFNFDATMNLPVVVDRVALRGSVSVLDRPGYITNRYGQDANKQENYSARIQGRVAFTEQVILDLLYQHNATDAGLNYYNTTDINRNPVPRYLQTTIEQQGFHDRLDIYNATLGYDMGIGKVTGTASFTRRRNTLDRPGSQVMAATARGVAEDRSTRSIQRHNRYNRVDAYELRFASDWGGPLSLLAGVYYQKDKRDFQSVIPTVDATGHVDGVGGIYGPILQDSRLKTTLKEKAAFGEVTFDLTDRLQLTGGVRVFEASSRAVPNVVTGVLGARGSGVGPISELSDSSAIFRGIASYKIADGTNFYAQIAQGYRAGGANNQAAAALGGATVPAGFISDSLISYEAGLKHQSADRDFTFAAAAFWVDWTDMQLTLRTPPTPGGNQYSYIGNAGRARVYGAELEASLRPVNGLQLGLTGSYTNSTVRETIARSFNRGDRVPFTPKWQATAAADYTFDLGGNEAFVGADVAWVGNRTSDFPINPLVYLVFKDYVTVSARAGIDFDGYRVGLTVRNLLDDDTQVDQFWNQPPQAINGVYRNAPRTVSLEIGFKI